MTFAVLVVSVAMMSYYSIVLLTELGDALEVDSYEDITRKVFQMRFKGGTFGLRLASLIIFMSISVSFSGYCFLLKAELPEITKYLASSLVTSECIPANSWLFDGNTLMIAVSFLLICPLCFARHLDFLKYTSALGLFSIIFCIGTIVTFKFKTDCGAIVLHRAKYNVLPQYAEDLDLPVDVNATMDLKACHYNTSKDTMMDIMKFDEILRKMSMAPDNACRAHASSFHMPGLVSAFLTIVYSFLNHDVVLSIYAELNNKSPAKMMRVCMQAYTYISLLYMLTGLAGYFTWYEASVPEFLLTYTHAFGDQPIIILAKLFVVLCTTLSAPIVHYAGRKSICMLIFGEYSLREYDDNKYCRNLLLQFVYPIIFISVAMMAMANSSAYGIILNMGGWTGTTLYLFMPPFLWLLYFTYTPDGTGCDIDSVKLGKGSRVKKYVNVIMLIAATIVLVYELVQTIQYYATDE